MPLHTAPSRRLLSALPYLAPHARVADVGTDHAYLPIHLIATGAASHAVACDINQGPIESARANIAAAGLAGHIDTVQTDGLHGIEAYEPDHILIFGMGGELIIRILEEAPWVRREGITLILQPMSRAHLLRAWLIQNGFSIFGETLTYEDKYYQTVAARYTGKAEPPYSNEELYLGRLNLRQAPPELVGFLRHEIGVLEAVLRGKAKSETADTREESALLDTFKTRLESLS